MKKFLATVLALMLALTGLAYAEPVESEVSYTLVRFVTEATETTPADESYALLGEGNGEDALNLYGLDDAEYADSYAALWQNVAAQLQPAVTIEGAFESLIFTTALDEAAQVEKTIVVMNGETVLEVEGLVAFVMLPEALGEIVPQIDEKCDAYIWTPEGLYEAAEICPNCGEAKIGDSHTAEISVFCKEDHTQCMGNPIHECDGCGRSYECSASNSHTKCIKCGKLWCYKAKGDHKETKCGHRGCEVYGEEEDHAKCVACGKYLCNGKDHKLAACGKHHVGAEGDHSAAACGVAGHFKCEGGHAAAACGIEGHYVCAGDHSAAACGVDGHFKCEGGHAAGACGVEGHYACAGDHAAAACGVAGHFNCAGSHGAAACGVSGHYVCEGNHAAAACGVSGHYVCEGNHAAAGCGVSGHYVCEGNHAAAGCGKSGHYVCEGGHAAAGCGTEGHYVCEGGHAAAGCGIEGHYVCAGNHEKAACGIEGHYVCEGDHSACA